MDPNLLLLLGFLGIMYFVMIRPQQKRQKQHAAMLGSISVGDDVITIGGMHGRVDAVGDDHLDLEVTDDVVLRFQKSAISKVLTAPSVDADADADAVADMDSGSETEDADAS
ncbi:MAG TPA: preprotein translocase subunit YajC [Nitriliruptorales bacterium]